MKTVAIISEYNPFHSGHLYQINKIREKLGEDTAVVAVMSGSFTQRGEIACADKLTRARAAVECGVDLVLEIPFPFSASSAELYARAGVGIADAIGVVDYLAFGCEDGDISRLRAVAELTETRDFKELIEAMRADESNRELGYPRMLELAAKQLCDASLEGLFTPNNILAIEYLRAIKALGSKMQPFTVKRVGAGYNETTEVEGEFQSASLIRELTLSDPDKALSYLPHGSREVYSRAMENGLFPTEQSRLDSAVISSFRLSSPVQSDDIHDATGGLYNRLHDLSFEADSISSLISSAETKKYTRARIRRAIWNSFFGVTSSEAKDLPEYTQLLGCNGVGRELLRKIKKCGRIAVITKPSDYFDLGDKVIRQKELCDKADSVFALAHKRAVSGRFALKLTPFVKKD